MSQTPLQAAGSARYEDGWRAINELIRSGGSWSGHERNVCLRNDGGGRFSDVSLVSGLDFDGDGRAWTVLDLDHDGDLDLALKFRTSPQVRILRNDTGAARALMLELRGSRSNRDAVGARVTIETGRRRLTRVVSASSGFLAQSSRRLHFAFERGESPQLLSIEWPSGLRRDFREVPPEGLWRIAEGSQAPARLAPRPAASPRPPDESEPGPGTWLTEPLPAPAVDLPSLDGLARRLADFRGRKVLLNFWATWCPPCRAELAELGKARAALEEAGLSVLTVNLDEPEARSQVAALGVVFPVLLAGDEAKAAWTVFFRRLFDFRRELILPLSFLIDEDGRVIRLYQGPVSPSPIMADAKARQRPALPFAGRWLTGAPSRDWAEVATAFAEHGLLSLAREWFELARAHGQDNVETWNNLAGALIAEGEQAEAERLLRRVLAVNPAQPDASTNLGMLLLESGRAAEALTFLDRGAQVRPHDAKIGRLRSAAHNDLGIAHMQAGHRAEAAAEFRRAIAADPDDAAGYVNLALYHVKAGDAAAAREILARLLRRHPAHEAARELLRQIERSALPR